MKFLAFLIILAALGLFGSAFLGVYKAPGLEDFPTAESLGLMKKTDGKAEEEEAKTKKKGESGIFPVNSKGAVSERNNYLEKSKGQVAPGS